MKCQSCGTTEAKDFTKGNGDICKWCAKIKADIKQHYLKIKEANSRHAAYEHEKIIEGLERMLEIRAKNVKYYLKRRQK